MAGEMIENPFDSTGFDLATMTEAINLLPNRYGRYQQSGLFTVEPVSTRVIEVDELDGTLNILPALPVGAPPTESKHDKAKSRFFKIPHIPHKDTIKAEDIQNARRPGGYDLETLSNLIMVREARMRMNHAITLEHLMAGALRGIIYDYDGTTVLYNLYTEFGITQKVLNFVFTTATTAIPTVLRNVKRHIEDNLRGDVMDKVYCDASEEWMDAFLEHPTVKEVFLGHQAALKKAGIGGDARQDFEFEGIIFNEYRAKAPGKNGTLKRFIPADEAIFYPGGTTETFKVHNAPANRLDTVNTPGLPLYAWQTMEPNQRWIDLFSEANPLTICRRPGTLVKATKS